MRSPARGLSASSSPPSTARYGGRGTGNLRRGLPRTGHVDDRDGDGRYLISLQGVCRFRVAEELGVKTPFRQCGSRRSWAISTRTRAAATKSIAGAAARLPGLSRGQRARGGLGQRQPCRQRHARQRAVDAGALWPGREAGAARGRRPEGRAETLIALTRWPSPATMTSSGRACNRRVETDRMGAIEIGSGIDVRLLGASGMPLDQRAARLGRAAQRTRLPARATGLPGQGGHRSCCHPRRARQIPTSSAASHRPPGCRPTALSIRQCCGEQPTSLRVTSKDQVAALPPANPVRSTGRHDPARMPCPQSWSAGSVLPSTVPRS